MTNRWLRLPLRSFFLLLKDTVHKTIKDYQEVALIVTANVAIIGSYLNIVDIIFGIALIAITLITLKAYLNYKFAYQNDVIEVKSGVFKANYKKIPFTNNIRFGVTQELLEQILRVHTLHIYTKDASKESLIIRGLSSHQISEMQSALSMEENSYQDTSASLKMSKVEYLLSIFCFSGWAYAIPAMTLFLTLLFLFNGDSNPEQIYSRDAMESSFVKASVMLNESHLMIGVIAFLLFAFRFTGKMFFYLPSVFYFRLYKTDKTLSATHGLLKKAQWEVPIKQITKVKLETSFLIEWLGFYQVEFIVNGKSSTNRIPCIHKNKLKKLLSSIGVALPHRKEYKYAPIRHFLVNLINSPSIIYLAIISVMLPSSVYSGEHIDIYLRVVTYWLIFIVGHSALCYLNTRTHISKKQLSVGLNTPERCIELIPKRHIKSSELITSALHNKHFVTLRVGVGHCKTPLPFIEKHHSLNIINLESR